jgi:hypothetical protein
VSISSGGVLSSIRVIAELTVLGLIAWAVWRLSKAIPETIVLSRRITASASVSRRCPTGNLPTWRSSTRRDRFVVVTDWSTDLADRLAE